MKKKKEMFVCMFPPLHTMLLNSLLGSKGLEHSTPFRVKQKSQGNIQSLTTGEERSWRSFHRSHVPLRVHKPGSETPGPQSLIDIPDFRQ